MLTQNHYVFGKNALVSDAHAQAFILAANIIDNNQQLYINNLVIDLKNANIWNKIKAFYPMVGSNAFSHKFNLKDPRDLDVAFRLLFIGSGTHSNLGYTGNGTNACANTNFIPSQNQNVNSNGLTVVVGTNNAVSGSDPIEMGSNNFLTQSFLLAVKNNNTTFRRAIRLNGDVIFQDGINDARGIFTAVRQSSLVAKLVRNTVTIASTTTNNGTLPNVSVYIGALNNNNGIYGASNQRIQTAIMHDGFSDSEVTTLHLIIDNFENALGRKTW